jgi:hypothetical protein
VDLKGFEPSLSPLHEGYFFFINVGSSPQLIYYISFTA